MANATVRWDGRDIAIEYAFTGGESGPLVIFLHDGLGSVSAWGEFPARLCKAAGCRGIVYSRPGYGQSTPRADSERWEPDFMHRQAHEVLPALLATLGIDPARSKPWLFGHSDGGSIALLFAARFPDSVSGLIVVAPHIRVEPVSTASIEDIRSNYNRSGLRARLARHHADPESAFYGWNDAWCNPAFRDWSIEEELKSLRCPVLAIQGTNDEYGTLEQIHGIARRSPRTRLLELAGCGHAPYRERPEIVLSESARFMRHVRVTTGRTKTR
ncbi:MAG TPA: alpha/beta hydrolase [Burkholderiales bacterium]|nr:alpha/beta hydrolase [Burkholderiales bacterium]